MSVEVLETIKKQVEVLSAEEKTHLANYLLEQTEESDSHNGENEKQNISGEIRQKRMEWLKANREKYGGQYVVLDGDKLLGVAKTFPEGKKIAKDAGVPDAFVNYLSSPDEVGYIGGW
jgi:hypothetical protein